MAAPQPVDEAKAPFKRHGEDILQHRFHSKFALPHQFKQTHLHLSHSSFRIIQILYQTVISHF